MKKTRYVMCVLLLLLYGPAVSAGSFRSLGIKEGLSSRQVFQVDKDSAGFIWAFTRVGVDRYDGNEIRHYRLEEMEESKNHILSATVMTCDPKGNIWIALKNGKVYAYDRRADAFRLRIRLPNRLSAPILFNILFDEADEGWLCMSDGIYRWREGEEPVLVALKGHRVNCLIRADEDTFYAGTVKGLFRLRRETGKNAFAETELTLPDEIAVEALYATDRTLFVGTFANGVWVLDRTTDEVHPLGDFVPHVPVRCFAAAGNNDLLIGVDGAGMFRLDMETEQLRQHYMADENDTGSLNGNTVSDICVDRNGGIWVGTSTNGISYLNPALPDIRRVEHERNNPNSLKSNHVNVLFQDSEGDIWYGTNNGVSLYRTDRKQWTHFLGGTGHSAKVVLALAEDAQGNVWAGGYGIGVYRIRKRSGQVEKMEAYNERTGKGMATEHVYSIHAQGDLVWLGGIEGKLTCYNVRTGAYIYYPVDCVGDMTPGRDGTLLMAGCDGLGVFDTATGEVTWHREFGDFVLRYPIRCLLRASSGDVWMATDGEGLVCYHPDEEKIHIYSTADGLESNTVCSLLEDNDGRIWFNTERELYCLNQETGMIVRAGDFLDMAWGAYNANAACKLDDGCLAFGTAEGAMFISPLLNLEQHHPLRLILTDFKLLYESVRAGEEGSLLKANIDDTREVDLRHDQNSFSISFSALNFVSPHRVRYEYILENYNEQWEQASDVQSVNYMNLSPGKYLFRLRAFDKYTGAQLGERRLEVVIHSSVWVSWWALLAYFIVLCTFVYLVIQNLKHRLYENRIQDKIRSFISIAHDIRTPVTLIKAPLSELQAQEELPEESRKPVAVAVKNVEKLLAMISQLLDLQKTELQSEKGLKVALYDVKGYMEEKVAEFHLAAMQKSVTLRLEVEQEHLRVWMDREKMDHIVDNLLSNALKYTEQGCITVSVRCFGKKWQLAISDTGIGIPKEEQHNIFHEYYRARNAMNCRETGSGIGLMVTRRLVRQHRGNITFHSEEGKGTTFVVTFPLKPKGGVTEEVPGKKARLADEVSGEVKMLPEESGKNVLLLAEDDRDMREYLTSSLSNEYKVVAVADGGKALEVAQAINPDIVISDIVMPVLEGDELCRILKSSVETSHIPVILLTGLSERQNIIFGLEAGANDYIIKPFDLSVLKLRIRNILQSRQQLRETVLALDELPEEADYTGQLDKDFLDQVMEIVQRELSNSEFLIGELCTDLGMSRTSFYKKMKTLTGQGPSDFIRIVRLNRAKELLASKKYSVGEISTMVGFADPKYFSTCFKKQFGITPSKILLQE